METKRKELDSLSLVTVFSALFVEPVNKIFVHIVAQASILVQMYLRILSFTNAC